MRKVYVTVRRPVTTVEPDPFKPGPVLGGRLTRATYWLRSGSGSGLTPSTVSSTRSL